jgi:hypothetical protein
LVKFPLGEDDSITVEMDDDQLAGFTPASVQPGAIVATASESFETAIDRLLPAMQAISQRVQTLAPDEISLAVGVKVTAEAGVIVARAAGEANFTLTLKWSQDNKS